MDFSYPDSNNPTRPFVTPRHPGAPDIGHHPLMRPTDPAGSRSGDPAGSRTGDPADPDVTTAPGAPNLPDGDPGQDVAATDVPIPPAAPRHPVTMVAHGDERIDDWAWLRNREDPAVLDHLRAEQAYTDAVTGPLRHLREALFHEIRSRIVETDQSVPVGKDDWWYYQRTVEGLDYPVHCRAPRRRPRLGPMTVAPGPDGHWVLEGEQVLLDENELVPAGAYLAVGDLAVSPGHGRLAYSTDTTGDERFTLHLRSLAAAGHTAPGPGDPALAERGDTDIEGTSYGVVWADDDTVFYTRPDHANRPHQCWRHRLGTAPTDDVLVHQENDERFHLGVSRTKDGAYVLIEAHSKVSSEVLAVPTADPAASPVPVLPRRPGVEYGVEHHGDTFLVLTNDGAHDFRLMALDQADAGQLPPRWRTLVAGRPGVRLEGFEVFARHLVLAERLDGSARLRVCPLAGGGLAAPLDDGWLVPTPERPSTSWAATNPEFDTTSLRYEYSSLVTPRSVYDLDMDDRQAVLLKQQRVLGGFDPSHYVSERLWATATDGTRVPVSVVRHRDTPVDGTAPCLVYGYGAYEHSIDPVFSSIRLCLLDRGVVFAIAHVRGGGELGRRWYEEGKLEHKPNSFSDFIACAAMLVDSGWADPRRLVARGGSAGGLLMGAALNLAPGLLQAVVAEVPFVDCLTTMLDASLPLTVIERDEWGDPEADPVIYRVMRSYSPVDNVRPVPYPTVLATAGLEDPRVGYWEPVKWVQRLRAAHPGNRAMVRVDLQAGHGGPSGRYDAWRDEAFVLAFVLDAMGIGR